MKKLLDELELIQTKEVELQMLIKTSGKSELAQCIRMLSMYIAIYKKRFGELPPDSYEKLLSSEEVDVDTARIFDNGMLESIAILGMVIKSNSDQENYRIGSVTIN